MTNETELSSVYNEASALIIELQIEKTQLAVKVKELESENEKLKRQLEFYRRQSCSKVKI